MSNSISFLNSFIDFEPKLHQTAVEAFSLKDIKSLLDHLGRPDQDLKIIHIAGTKGKGSTAVMMASLLREAGYSVGLYTSPHLYDVKERIRILRPFLSSPNISIGDPSSLKMDSRQKHSRMTEGEIFTDSISESEFDDVIQEIREAVEDVHRASSRGLTFFEVLTAVALSHFAKEKVDWVVLETGLGGRLDATNAVDSIAAVITPISLDHQHILGQTIEEIAAEKAGIIKSKSQRVIIAPQVPEAAQVLRSRCEELGVTPVWVEENVSVDLLKHEHGQQILNFKTPSCEYKNIRLSLAGACQRSNAATAVCVAETLGVIFASGRLNAAFSAMHWPGRFEVAAQHPTVILDCAHNEESMRVLLETLAENFPEKELCFVLGVSKDKNIEAIGQLLQNRAKCVILTRVNHARARVFSQEDGVKYFSKTKVIITESIAEAVQSVQAETSSDDVVVVTGSVFVVAEARKNYV